MRPYEKFGPFLLAFPLGRGGMGEVHAARTPWPGRPLAAVKRLRLDVASTPTYAERFAHEAELAVRLVHPNIVDTIDVGAVDGRLYIASELIVGKSIGAIADHLLMQRQGAPTAIVIRILLDVLAGLAYGHAATDRDGRWLRLVHRDVTPGNVLVGYDGVARLTDFGLAKSLLSDDGLTQVGAIVGTPSYIAPELIRAERPSPAADIYSLGAVAYRFLTGIPPFDGTKTEIMQRALTQRPRSILEIRPDLPEWFAEFVHDMLDPSVATRPGDARILAAELERDAKAHELLIEASWVDVWMGTYFEKERVQALAEARAVAAMEAIEPNLVVEKTEIFARTDLLGTVAPRSKSFAELPTHVYRDDRGDPDDPTGFSDPDTFKVGSQVNIEELQIAGAPRLTPQPSRAEPQSGHGLLDSGALVSPVGLPASSSHASGAAATGDLPTRRADSAVAKTMVVAVAPATVPMPLLVDVPPSSTSSTSIHGSRKRPWLVLGSLFLALSMLITGFVALSPARDREEVRRHVIARLDVVRGRIDRKIERREAIHPAAFRALANATRAALAGDYLRADVIIAELERGLDAIPTSTVAP